METTRILQIIGIVVAIGAVLVFILVPMSFSGLEYHQVCRMWYFKSCINIY